ncbi:MAG: ferrous iron transport protein B, partial [Bacillota bacterium]
ISHGSFGKDVVIDTPGVYGVSSFNEEEMIARDVIMGADIVINIVDAVHMERDLFLTQQIIDMGLPVIVALNMMDEAVKQGLNINVPLLSELLGVPVIQTVAVIKQGFEELKQSIHLACPGNITPGVKDILDQIQTKVPNQGEALLIQEGDPHVASRHKLKPHDKREEIYGLRRQRVNGIVDSILTETSVGASLSTRLGRWMIRPWIGIPILLLVLWLTYEIIGVLIAQKLVGYTEGTLMKVYYEPFIKTLISKIIAENSIPGRILIGEFGILTMTVTYILGLLLPLVVGFYLILSTMEDSGYLPRIATLTDRVLTGIGLNGRAVIPLILGLGCVTAATITTRLLGSDRERRIATFLLAIAIPCSAQLAVITGMLAGMGWKYVSLYVICILGILVTVGTLLNRILPGSSTDLLIDLPPLRLPRLGNVLKKTWTKSSMFLKEATPLFAVGALLLGIMQVSGLLQILQQLLAPVTVGWLQLPKEAATAFIMGFVRRDFGAAGLYALQMSSMQKVVALVTITIFVPCIASAMVIFKERGKKEALIVWPTIMIMAFIIGGVISQILI